MLPAQRNKVDISSMSEEEKKLFKLYGKFPTKKGPLNQVQKGRKYFDSGDYMMSKAGQGPAHPVGTEHPHPASIPHVSPPASNSVGVLSGTSPTNTSTSPIKESNLAREPELADPHPELARSRLDVEHDVEPK